MATMITEVYEAFRKVGIPDPEAKHAAEALSAENVSTKADINGAEKRLGEKISREVAALDDKLSPRINDLDEKLSEKISREVAALDDKLSLRINDLDEKLSEKISGEVAALDEKFSDRMTALDEKFSRELADVKASIAKQDRQMAVMQWMMGTTIAGILFLIGGAVSIAINIFF